MQKGELVVINTGSISISLTGTVPGVVQVEFKDTSVQAPCDPGNVDSLDFTIVSGTSGLVLTINWSVSTVREIEYVVAY